MRKTILLSFVFLFLTLPAFALTREEAIQQTLVTAEAVISLQKAEVQQRQTIITATPNSQWSSQMQAEIANLQNQSIEPALESSVAGKYLSKESFQPTLEDTQQFSQLDKVTFSTGKAEIRQGAVWELGTEVSHITYKEPSVMEEKGLMYGIVGSYTYRGKSDELLLPEGSMLKLEGRGAWGKVDYDGGLSDGTPYTINNIDDFIWEFRGLAGADFPIFKATTLTPYTGMGYRYLNDDPSIDPAGYRRESNYIYSPIGVEITTPLKNGWSVGATLEYDYFWKGTQKSHLGDFLAGLDTLENNQDQGHGIRGSIKVQKKVEKIDLVIEPYIRYWDIEKSNVKAITYSGTPIGLVGWEPKNNSTEFGIRFAAKL